MSIRGGMTTPGGTRGMSTGRARLTGSWQRATSPTERLRAFSPGPGSLTYEGPRRLSAQVRAVPGHEVFPATEMQADG